MALDAIIAKSSFKELDLVISIPPLRVPTHAWY